MYNHQNTNMFLQLASVVNLHVKGNKGRNVQTVPHHGDLEPDELVAGLNYNSH
jgi:hypothetical protein